MTKFGNYLVTSKYTSSLEEAANVLSAARTLASNKVGWGGGGGGGREVEGLEEEERGDRFVVCILRSWKAGLTKHTLHTFLMSPWD